MLYATRIALTLINSRLAERLIRGAALFLGCFVWGSWVLYLTQSKPYDANIWWIDLRGFSPVIAAGLSMVFGLALLHRAAVPAPSDRVRRLRVTAFALMVFILTLNSFSAIELHLAQIADAPERSGGVWMGVPIPLTAVLAIGVLLMLRTPAIERSKSKWQSTRRGLGIATVAAGFALLAALAQMHWFGESDYRRPADAILVYGCKAYPDGTPSQALADRIHTACELYHQGLAPRIVMSGGPVDEHMHETQAMADYAVSLGVPREAILFDPQGLDTQATAHNLTQVLGESTTKNKPLRVLAVSHDYHLPRVKLSLEREGVQAYTVPCEIRRSLPSKPYLMARETAAWWYYYFSPLAAS